MDEVRSRLARCFAAVFPNLALDQIPEAEPSKVAGWDSVASVTLIATIEEEFGVEFDAQKIANVLSFAKLFEYLQSLGGASADS
jgi:acyl carrier protein